MKTMKKVLALVLAMAMVLAMSVTAFAAPATSSITINNLTKNDGTVVNIYQIISHNADSSDWEVVSWADDYVTLPPGDGAMATIDWAGLKEYVNNAQPPITADGTLSPATDATSVEFTKLEVGAYLVLASGTNTQYNAMGVATYDYDDQDNLIEPISKTIDAKGEGYTVTKELDGNEVLVKRGQEITYNIESVFPSFPEDDKDREVSITDMPTGMYVKEVEVYVADTKLTLGTDYTLSFVKDGEATSRTALPATENEWVTVNFTEAFTGMTNAHATQDVRVVVKSIVTDVTNLKNEAKGSHDSTPTEVLTRTGSITITKKDMTETKTLSGAEFSFKLVGETEPLKFVNVSEGVYKLALPEEITDDTVDKFTDLEVNEDGVLVVKGLGAGEYDIDETKAPEGYSINGDIENVTLALGATENKVMDVKDSKLSSLPSTGGIGTTIFTIGGCVIMIVAAGMFFASRRKEEN